MAGEPDRTSPEELLAAAHAACFTMALGATLAHQRRPPTSLVTDVTYVLDSTEGHWQIISAELDVRGRIENLDDEDFAQAAADAGETCVVSKAVSGNVRITTRSRLLR